MAVLSMGPVTELGRVAQAAKADARAAKAKKSWWRRSVRGVVVGVAVLFAVLGFSGGTAQAWPWDVGEDVTAFITHFCSPMDIDSPSNGRGIDTALGLNDMASDKRDTIVPNTIMAAGQAGNGQERLNKAYGSQPLVANPTYERYGFSSLHWTSFGGDCWGVGHWITPIAEFVFNLFVLFPMIIAMGLLSWAMNNVLYDAFATITQPVVAVFSGIFEPWIYVIAPIGVLFVWVKSKGSPQQVMKAGVWVVTILGVFLWMSHNTSTLASKANNFVTEFAGNASCKMSELSGGGQACDAKDPLGNINQSLWYGIPYQTWMLGQIGEEQAKASRTAEQQGQIGWGAAILNGNYVGNDPQGKKVRDKIAEWNNRSYSPNGDDSKTDGWADEGYWQYVPALANVKFMCNDVGTGGRQEFDEGADYQRWLYGGNCDAAGAGTASMVPYIQGEKYSDAMVVAFTGGFAATAVLLCVALVAVYLMLQKMLFFFLLAWGPIFLTVAAFGDEKRRRFAIRYGEMLLSNVVKQCVAVCAVLFVSYSMSTLLFPPPSLGIPDIPYLVKPFVALIFFIALILFALPMANIVKAAVKGDTSVVDKVANAPAEAGKAALKVGAMVGAAAATGGASSLTGLGGAAMGGKGGALLSQAGRVMGSRGGVGRGLMTAGRAMTLRQSLMDAKAQKEGADRAMESGVQALAGTEEGKEKYKRDKDGKLTPESKKKAEADYRAMVAAGASENKSAKAADAHMAQFFAGYQEKNGKYHASDPNSPENLRAAQLQAAAERLAINNEAKDGTARAANSSEGLTAADVSAKSISNSKAGLVAEARDAVDRPGFARNSDLVYSGAGQIDAASVMETHGLSRQMVTDDPSTLLTGMAYGGGDTTQMDPAHPATESLTNLRFAIAHGREDEIRQASADASSVIADNGIPPEVRRIRSAGDTAREFQSISVVGAMPEITEDTGWEARAAGARTMQAAATVLPADHPATDQVQDYVEALSNPAVPADQVGALQVQAIEALENTGDYRPSGAFSPSSTPKPGFFSSGMPLPPEPSYDEEPPEDHAPRQPRPEQPAREVDRDEVRAVVEDAMRDRDLSAGQQTGSLFDSGNGSGRGPRPERVVETPSAPVDAEEAPVDDGVVEAPRDPDEVKPYRRSRRRRTMGFFGHDAEDDNGSDEDSTSGDR